MKRLLGLLVCLLILAGCARDYSDGFRIGTINKFSNKGLFFKTWEGEMNLGGVRADQDSDGNRTMVANIWSFSIDGAHSRNENIDGLVKDLTKAAEDGNPVKIYYKQDICFCPDRGDTFYFVQKVEFLAHSK